MERFIFFGVWACPQKSVDRWLDEKDDLLAGRIPRSRLAVQVPTLRDLCNAFLTTKANLRDSGELSVHTWNDYHNVCEHLIKTFGPDRLLTDVLPEDFAALRAKWSEKWGFVRVGNMINKAPGGDLRCYVRTGDEVFQTYETKWRGIEAILPTLQLLGRQETWEDSPAGWPQDKAGSWWRRDGRPIAQCTRTDEAVK